MWHLTFAVFGRFQAFLDEKELRLLVRTLARILGPRLISWAVPGDHVHVLIEGTRAEVGRLGRDLRFALRALGVQLLEPHYRAITGRDHAENVVVYHLRQAVKHSACDRPALFSGGCFLDLVGARIVEGYDPERLLAHVPRFDLSKHLEEVVLPSLPKRLPESEIRGIGAVQLAAACGAAFAVGPGLKGRSPAAERARRVVAALCEAAGSPRSEVAFALECTPQAVGRLVRAPRVARFEEAVRLRLALERAAGSVAKAGGPRT